MRTIQTILFVLCCFSAFSQCPKSGPVTTVTLGETVANNSWIYISTVDGKAYKADGSDRTKYAYGLVYVGGVADDVTQAFTFGENPWPDGDLNPTNYYYLSSLTDGEMTDAKPSAYGFAQALCVALTDSIIFILPSQILYAWPTDYYEITGATPQTARANVDNLINPTFVGADYEIDLPLDPVDGETCEITFARDIAIVVIDGGDITVSGTAYTTSIVGDNIKFKYYASPDVWIRIK